MRTFSRYLLATCLVLFVVALTLAFDTVSNAAQAAEVASANVNLTWVDPTTNTDASPLTDLKDIKVYADVAHIPDDTTAVPISVPAGTKKYAYTTTVPNGATLFFRLKACNLAGTCSALTAEISKTIKVVVPNTVTGVAVTVTVTVTITQ